MKYRETKDLEEVRDACNAGLKVTDCKGEEIAVVNDDSLRWGPDGGFLLATVGRVFRIEIPEPKLKMVRVGFHRDRHGLLRFYDPGQGYSTKYTDAPAVLGPGGYEYAERPGILFDSPALFWCPKNKIMYGVASLADLASGDRVPTRPVAYWYFSEEKA